MVIPSFQALKKRWDVSAPKRAIVAAAHDPHTLEAVCLAQRDRLIVPTLVGRREEILSAAAHLGLEVPHDAIIEAHDDSQCAKASIELVRQGRGDLLIKGLLPTATLLKEVVHQERGICSSSLLSHVAILDVPAYHKLIFLTDGGMVIAPTLEEKRAILHNTLEFCRFLGYDCPKAAVLCAVEVEHPRMPETQDAAILKQEAQAGRFGSCLVEGPISLDLATDLQSAHTKGYHSPVAGDADIFLVPTLTAGNLLGKALYGMAGGKMAGLVLGASIPITVNSRGATPEEKYHSILIAAAMAGQPEGGFHVPSSSCH